MKHSNLNEGLREGDLHDLFIPMISIDEYESKITHDKDVIVVGFFAEDKEPAKELNRFINRTSLPILDSDVSPAPTESGYFIVFVEIDRNEEAFQLIADLLRDVKAVTEISKWTFKAYKVEKILDFNKENFNRYVRINTETHESFSIRKFFNNALVENIFIKENGFKISNYNFTLTQKLDETVYPVTLEDISLTRKLDSMLGSCYSVNTCGKKITIKNIPYNETLYAELT